MRTSERFSLSLSLDVGKRMGRLSGARDIWVRITERFRRVQTTPFGTNNKTNNTPTTTATNNSYNNKGDNVNGSSLSKYDAYRDLDKLDFMTAAKILFTTPPKKKKFGIDFHLVQLFFACMPSLAVYLVAQYARYEMRRMEAELELKKQAEAKAKEMELKAAEENEAECDPHLLEVKVRLDKLEEAVKEIVVESKKQTGITIFKNQKDGSKQKQPATTESSRTESEASNSAAGDDHRSQTSTETTAGLGQGRTSGPTPVSDASQQDQKGTQVGGPSRDPKK